MGFTTPAVAQTSLVSQGAGGIASAVGSFASASAQRSSLGAQAAIANINARIAELGAQSVLNQGKQQVAQTTLKYGALKSSQRAALAANGVDLGVGNAAEIQASTDIMKETDANTIKANAIRSAWGYRTQAANYQSDALMKKAQASGISPGVSAATSLLGSAGQVSSSWYKMNQEGALKGTMFELSSGDPIYDMGKDRNWWGA